MSNKLEDVCQEVRALLANCGREYDATLTQDEIRTLLDAGDRCVAVEKLFAGIAAPQKEIADLKAKLARLTAERDRAFAMDATSNNQINDMHRKLAACEKERDEAKARVVGMIGEVASAKYIEAEERQRHSRVLDINESLHTQLVEAVEQRDAARAELAKVTATLTDIMKARERIMLDQQGTLERLAAVEKELALFKDDEKGMRATFNILAEHDKLTAERDAARAENARLRAALEHIAIWGEDSPVTTKIARDALAPQAGADHE